MLVFSIVDASASTKIFNDDATWAHWVISAGALIVGFCAIYVDSRPLSKWAAGWFVVSLVLLFVASIPGLTEGEQLGTSITGGAVAVLAACIRSRNPVKPMIILTEQ